MSLIVNPSNPTPKQSPMTPNFVSQSYYLPTPTPDGKTSYDDCKQDDETISIPGVKPGDMFDYKSGDFWQLFYTTSDAYQDFINRSRTGTQEWRQRVLGERYFTAFLMRLTPTKHMICFTRNFQPAAF